MKLLKSTLISLVMISPLSSLEQSNNTPKFDQRQANQERRIKQGEQSG